MDTRMKDVVTYLVSVMESSRRFTRGLDPFDFGNPNVVEAMICKNEYFIEHDDDPDDTSEAPYKAAHNQYMEDMSQSGWTLGDEDYEMKTLPDLKPYDHLTMDQKKEIAFRAAIIHSLKGFYREFKGQIEGDLMEKMNLKDGLMNGFSIFGNQANISRYMQATH